MTTRKTRGSRESLHLVALIALACALPAGAQEPAPEAPEKAAPAEGDEDDTSADEGEETPPLVLRGRLHVGDGNVVADGAVVLVDGKVRYAGSWSGAEFPKGARLVEVKGSELSPGLIDAAARAGATDDVEHESEVVADLDVIDDLTLSDKRFKRLAKRGITSTYVAADAASVIGGRGCLVKTAGKDRVVLRRAGIKATLGPETWRRGARNSPPFGRNAQHTTRRPTTLMGNVWVFREAFASAATAEAPTAAQARLKAVLEGKLPLRIQAKGRVEIEAAFRLTRELGVPFVLEQAGEVHHLVRFAKHFKTPVIFGPVSAGAVGDTRYSTPRMLADAKVAFCLTAAGGQGEHDLWGQALLAVRYGLDAEAALSAVTDSPARILGVEKRLGRLAKGLDADVVIWSGPPMAATSRPLAVLVDGELVAGKLDASKQDKAKSRSGGRQPRRSF